MKSINSLYQALKRDRAGFIKGLIKAGYVDTVVFNNSGVDSELVRLAVNMYNDVWESFNVLEFESWIYGGVNND